MKRLFPLLIFLVGCHYYIPPVVAIPADDSACPAACIHLRDLGCPEGDPLPDGTSCEKFCSETQKAGHDLHPGCIAKIQSCEDQHLCSTK